MTISSTGDRDMLRTSSSDGEAVKHCPAARDIQDGASEDVENRMVLTSLAVGDYPGKANRPRMAEYENIL